MSQKSSNGIFGILFITGSGLNNAHIFKMGFRLVMVAFFCFLELSFLHQSALLVCSELNCRIFLLIRVILLKTSYTFSDADSDVSMQDNKNIGLSCVTDKVI